MGTDRQDIIDLLRKEPLDSMALSQAMGLKEKEIVDHLTHITKSVSARGGRLRMHPAKCTDCGYEFKDRRRLSPPSRCPRCKLSRIQGPWYHITELKHRSSFPGTDARKRPKA